MIWERLSSGNYKGKSVICDIPMLVAFVYQLGGHWFADSADICGLIQLGPHKNVQLLIQEVEQHEEQFRDLLTGECLASDLAFEIVGVSTHK